MNVKDNFMPRFKYYKQRATRPSFDDVLDFSTNPCPESCRITRVNPTDCDIDGLGLDSSREWNLYEVDSVPGLYFLPNPFTDAGQLMWSRRCLEMYAATPTNKTNLDSNQLQICRGKSPWEDAKTKLVDCGKDPLEVFKSSLIWKLRWATLGYHHNWNTKVYSEEEKSEFPQELNRLSRIFAGLVGSKHYCAQAAIVNFYHVGSTLSAHTDSSEDNLTFPLVSVSFGRSAIFLIGGETKATTPKAIFIRSGDVLIMTKQSRLSYHAVARVLSADEETKSEELSPKQISSDGVDPVQIYLENSRINMNVRQLK